MSYPGTEPDFPTARTKALPIRPLIRVEAIVGSGLMICWRVKLDRSVSDETTFHYEVELDGDLTAEQKHELALAANACRPSHIV